MSYDNKYGVTEIRKQKLGNMSISWEPALELDGPEDNMAVILFTPNMNNIMQHYHVTLNDTECVVLRDWLNAHLATKGK